MNIYNSAMFCSIDFQKNRFQLFITKTTMYQSEKHLLEGVFHYIQCKPSVTFFKGHRKVFKSLYFMKIFKTANY